MISLTGMEGLAFFKKNNSLIDSSVSRLEMKKVDNAMELEVDFELRKSSEISSVRFVFSGVKMVSFYYSDDYIFYNVERVKFLKASGGGFYLSLDPDEAVQGESDNDQDVILATKLDIYIINH